MASSIEWTDLTWNPTTGCTRVSAGCDHCYAAKHTRRLARIPQQKGKYEGLINVGKLHFNGVIRLHPDTLPEPLRRRKPTMYFVNSMSDLGHEGVPFPFLAAICGVMAACPRHVFQVLTKRPERLAAFFAWVEGEGGLSACIAQAAAHGAFGDGAAPVVDVPWPLPNVWIGTSVEDQSVADRVDALRAIPAAVRFISAEPLIGALDLHGRLDGVHWLIAGGESGAGARPMQLAWAADLRDACAEAGTAYFFKQTGSVLARELGLKGKGGEESEWPAAVLAVGGRAFPTQPSPLQP